MGAIQAWSGTPPTSRPNKARQAAAAIVADARLGPAMATNVEQHLRGLGRSQLATVVQLLFAELAAGHQTRCGPTGQP